MSIEPNAHPGCLAPHAWLERTASGAGVPLAVSAPRDARLRELYGAPFALNRPDQHVAWRGDGADVANFLRRVTNNRGAGRCSLGRWQLFFQWRHGRYCYQ